MLEQNAIRQWQSGDLEALGTLFQLHQQAVFETAYWIALKHDLAEDVTEEVFMELKSAIKRYDPRRPLQYIFVLDRQKVHFAG